MKFWQYVVGTGLAILIFSGAIFSEYSRYSKLSFLEKNPFTLMGEKKYPDKDYRDIITNDGEIIRVFKDAQINLDEKSREILAGKVFLGGSFFDDKNKNINYIKIGNLTLRYPGSNVVISRDLEKNSVEILNYGRSAELYFPNKDVPFLLPSETQIKVNLNDSSKDNYYQQLEEFKLKIIETENPLTEILKNGISKIHGFRSYFKDFATKMPNFWQESKLDSLKSWSAKISGKKNLSDPTKEILKNVFEIMNTMKSDDKVSRNMVKSLILETSFNLSDSELINSLRKINEWSLFEKAQKIWLPLTDYSKIEYLYNGLWGPRKNGVQKIFQIVDSIELYNSQLKTNATDTAFAKLKEELAKIKASDFSKSEITELRRRLFYILKSKMIFGETLSDEIIATYLKIEKLETDVYKEKSSLDEIEEEKVGQLLEIISEYINEEDDFPRKIVKNIITFLQDNIDLDKFKTKHSDNTEFQKTLADIELVGTSGLTPKEIDTLNAIKNEEKELNSLIPKSPIQTSTEEINHLIKNSKTLWQFLKDKGINIDIKTFRTTKNSLKFETKFENTETGKRKIFGIFNYREQIFSQLRLGNASIRSLPPNALEIWLKKNKGKFEPVQTEEVKEQPVEDIINQNSRKAIISRQFLKDLLISLHFKVSKINIKVTNKELTKLSAKDISFKEGEITGSGISLNYDLDTQKFSQVAVNTKDSKKYLSEGAIDAKTLQEKSREFFKKDEKKE